MACFTTACASNWAGALNSINHAMNVWTVQINAHGAINWICAFNQESTVNIITKCNSLKASTCKQLCLKGICMTYWLFIILYPCIAQIARVSLLFTVNQPQTLVRGKQLPLLCEAQTAILWNKENTFEWQPGREAYKPQSSSLPYNYKKLTIIEDMEWNLSYEEGNPHEYANEIRKKANSNFLDPVQL